jgi:16S rRNA (cytosine967-C5)-methyltransferase
MHPNALLDLATELLRQVLKLDQPADAVVSAFFRKHRDLGPRERHTLAETTYTVLRQRLLLAPPGASGRARWSAGSRPRLAGQRHLPARRARPHEQQWLAEVQAIDARRCPRSCATTCRTGWPACCRRLGDEFWPLVEALNEPAPLDLRVNLLRAKREDVQRRARRRRHRGAADAVLAVGLRVQASRRCTSSISSRGDVEVQDEGSQLLAPAAPKRGEMVVDFCAGAGGKTLALGARCATPGAVRLRRLGPSAGRAQAAPGAQRPVERLPGADRARARRAHQAAGRQDRPRAGRCPCSGLGTLRRNPDLKWRQSPKALDELCTKQQAILASAARLVKPGGRLVYATCSLLRARTSSRPRLSRRPSAISSRAGRRGAGERPGGPRAELESGRLLAPVAAAA